MGIQMGCSTRRGKWVSHSAAASDSPVSGRNSAVSGNTMRNATSSGYGPPRWGTPLLFFPLRFINVGGPTASSANRCVNADLLTFTGGNCDLPYNKSFFSQRASGSLQRIIKPRLSIYEMARRHGSPEWLPHGIEVIPGSPGHRPFARPLGTTNDRDLHGYLAVRIKQKHGANLLAI